MRARYVLTLAGLLAACGGLGGPSADAVLRATVEVRYASTDSTLGFVPGSIEYGHQPWLSHPVELTIWTDDWVQHVSLYGHYEAEGSELVPTKGATLRNYVLSDEGPFDAEIIVDVDRLDAGEHSFSLAIPVHLEPSQAVGGTLQPEDTVLTVDFIYDVYWAETPLDEFCTRADQVLRVDSIPFSPESFIEMGAQVLTAEQLTRFEEAAAYFEAERQLGHTDPNPFFDLVEEMCDVRYRERWEGWS